MTSNQIAYWSYKEGQRHNLETEAFNVRQLDETRRHNLAYESETQRHNIANESYNRMSLAEAKRHNLATEAHNSSLLNETVRANIARETETNRTNVAHEREAYRSSVARETETRRSNVAAQNELNRTNRVKEQQQAEQLKINWASTAIHGVGELFDGIDDWRKTNIQARNSKTQERNARNETARSAAQFIGGIATAVSKLAPLFVG